MKVIIILDCANECVIVYPVNKKEEMEFDKDNFDLINFLYQKGYHTDNCISMVVNYSNGVPVYLHGENEPYTYL